MRSELPVRREGRRPAAPSVRLLRATLPALAALLWGAAGAAAVPTSPDSAVAHPLGGDSRLRLSGKGWYQFGRIMHSTDTLDATYNYNGNFQHSPGAQFTILADIGEHWDGAMGLGGYATQDPQGGVYNSTQRKNEIGFQVYVTQADFSWSPGSKEAPPFKATFGLFPFTYNPDTRNLGEYLLRGPVYPGILFSDFESKRIDPTVANTLGLNLHSELGGLSQDLILKSETDLPPLFDFSLAYIAQFKVKGIFEVGAGVNFHRLIPMKPTLTNLTDPGFRKDNRSPLSAQTPYQQKYI
jgi:hypothetical protein